MIVKNEKILKEFRTPGPCEWCGRWCQVREAAHMQRRSQGRLDIRINLWSAGGPFDCGCHHREHCNKLTTPLCNKPLLPHEVSDRILAIIARRERLSEVQVREEINRINRLYKWAPRCEVHGKGLAGYPLDMREWRPGPGWDADGFEQYCPECERFHKN
jgi:hypothetical protein